MTFIDNRRFVPIPPKPLTPPTPPVAPPVGAETTVQPKVTGTQPLPADTAAEKFTPKMAEERFTKLQTELGKVKTPEGLQDLSQRAAELSSQVAAGEFGQVDRPLAKDLDTLSRQTARAAASVAKLEAAQDQLAGSPQERTAAIAKLLADPTAVGADVRALKALQGSPLLDAQKAIVTEIGKAASPEALAKQLDKDPDLTHYPAGLVDDLAKMRDIPDPKLQASLDKVSTQLLAQSKDAVAKAKQADAVKAKMDEKAKAMKVAEALPDIGDIREKAIKQVEEKFGPDVPVPTVPPNPLSLEAIKANPAAAQLLAPMQASADPAVKAQMEGLAKGWAKESLTSHLKANEGGEGDGVARADKTIEDFKGELSDLAMKTGFGPTIEATSQAAIKDVATDVLNDPATDYAKVKANPAYGQLIGTLKSDPALKPKVDDKILAFADTVINDKLKGKEGEDGLNDGIEDFKKEMQSLGESTGLGLDEALGKKFSDDHKGKFEDVVDEGNNIFQDIGDFVGDAIGKLGFIGDAAEWAFDKVGDAANFAFDSVGKGLGALGWEGGEKALDKVGDFANKAYDLQGNFLGGVAHGITGIAGGAVFLVTHPVTTGKGIVAAVKDPGALKDALLKDAGGGNTGAAGIAHGLGYLAANLIPAIFSGGATAAGTAADVAGTAGRLASVASKLGKAGEVIGKAGEVTSKVTGAAGKLGDKAKVGVLGTKLSGKVDELASRLPGPSAADPLRNAGAMLRVKNALVAGKNLNLHGSLKALLGEEGAKAVLKDVPKPVQKLLEKYDSVLPNSVITNKLKGKLSDTQIDQLRTALKLNVSLQKTLAQSQFDSYLEGQMSKLS